MALSMYLTKEFWIATAERVIRTVAQAILASGALSLTPVINMDWQQVLAVGAASGLAAFLTCFAVGAATDNGSPSITKSEVLADDNQG
jgi:hypothetical protein